MTTLKPGDFVMRVHTSWKRQSASVYSDYSPVHTFERVYIAHPWASSNDDKRRAEMAVPWCQANEFPEKDHGLTWCLDDPEEIAALEVVLGLS
jgi:hypothetical protein